MMVNIVTETSHVGIVLHPFPLYLKIPTIFMDCRFHTVQNLCKCPICL